MNYSDKITPHFTWGEFLYLPKWKKYALETELPEEIKQNIIKVALKLEEIRTMLASKPITILSGYRPTEYNKLIGGAKKSAHIVGMAVDFSVRGVKPETVRMILLPLLEKLGIRMELDTPTWIHIDIFPPVNGKRTFKP